MATREAVKVTGKSIAAFYERWQPGTVVECTDNTFRAAAIGTAVTVLEGGTKTYSRVRLYQPDGTVKLTSIGRPDRVSKVTALTDDSITYAIFSDSLEHTATWRIVTEAVR